MCSSRLKCDRKEIPLLRHVPKSVTFVVMLYSIVQIMWITMFVYVDLTIICQSISYNSNNSNYVMNQYIFIVTTIPNRLYVLNQWFPTFFPPRTPGDCLCDHGPPQIKKLNIHLINFFNKIHLLFIINMRIIVDW